MTENYFEGKDICMGASRKPVISALLSAFPFDGIAEKLVIGAEKIGLPFLDYSSINFLYHNETEVLLCLDISVF